MYPPPAADTKDPLQELRNSGLRFALPSSVRLCAGVAQAMDYGADPQRNLSVR